MSKKKKNYKIDPSFTSTQKYEFVSPQNYRKQLDERFKWTIVYKEYIPSKSCCSEPFTKFLEHTIKALNDLETKSWNHILKQPHNHVIKHNQELKSKKKIKNKLLAIGKEVEIYQVKGNTKEHRIFGYRENGIFHVMLNDLNHNETKS